MTIQEVTEKRVFSTEKFQPCPGLAVGGFGWGEILRRPRRRPETSRGNSNTHVELASHSGLFVMLGWTVWAAQPYRLKIASDVQTHSLIPGVCVVYGVTIAALCWKFI